VTTAQFSGMDLNDAIRTRRSNKQFASRPITREEIGRLLDAAVHAPNHRLTQPWRFYVLGPDARRAYGAVLGARKAKKVEDPAAAQAVIEKVTAATAALPAMVVVAMVLAEAPDVREEDYAATMMAVQNLLLAAHADGLAAHLKSGAIMDDPRARAAVGAREGERIVMVVELGEPVAATEPKPRRDAAELTTWVP
jgi:nitroreductase